MRVGFAIGQKRNMDALREGYVPYALSTPAMEIACAVLSDPDAVQKRIEEVKVERKKMLEALKQMKSPEEVARLRGKSVEEILG